MTRRSTSPVAAALAILLAFAAPALAAATRIPLPPPPGSSPNLGPLPGDDPLENDHIPGPVRNTEVVHVGVGPSGSVVSVVGDQTLVMNGAGDFAFHVPGPALRVEAPPDQQTQPGLRRGAVLWQGFNSGEKTLVSRVTLNPKQDIFRTLPIRVAITVRRDDSPATLPGAGTFDVAVRLINNTAKPALLYEQTPDRASLAILLDVLHSALMQGRRPYAGRDGIPDALPATDAGTKRTEQIEIPVLVDGSILFRGRGIRGEPVRVHAMTGAGSPVATVHARVSAERLSSIQISLSARPSPPAAGVLQPARTSWRDEVADANTLQLRALGVRAQRVMWQVSMLADFDAYLGNPGKGASQTKYLYESAAPTVSSVGERERVRPLGIALTLVAAMLVAGNGTVLWRRS
ncbi:MAG: hypothetical protein ABR548_15295 [Actinomycetota bacterium]|nr:hypothetical protein [Actinomycetota bacterium]